MTTKPAPVPNVRESRDPAGLAPAIRRVLPDVLAACAAGGVPVLLFETTRTPERVAFLYGKGRTAAQLIAAKVDPKFAQPKLRIVTKAYDWPRSWHSHGLAFDLIHPTKFWTPPDPEHYWPAVAEIVKPFGFDWGGLWPTLPDVPHYQFGGVPIGPTLALRTLLITEGREAVWRRVGAL